MRLFIAVDIDENFRAVIAGLQRDLQNRINLETARLKWVDPNLMHLTLKFLGEVEEDKVSRVGEIVKAAAQSHKSFSFGIPALGCFGRPIKVIWLGAAEENRNLLQLHQDIENALDNEGWPKENRAFSPHLTLARAKDITKDRNLKDIIKKYQPVTSATVNVDSVRVYKSLLTPAGAIYTVLSETKLK